MLLVTRTRDSEFYGRDTHPSLSLMAPSPLVRVPFFKINIRFTRPRPCLGKGERGPHPPSFSMGAFSLNVFLFQLGGHYTSVNLICTLIIISNVISHHPDVKVHVGSSTYFVLLLNCK